MADTSTAPDSILEAGTTAPDFTLKATPDQSLSLSELKGNPVVLVFYPADWSQVCGDELAVFNQSLPLLQEYRAVLLGISVDSAWSHQAFKESRKLGYDLLADYNPKGAVSKEYGAYDEQAGCSKRALFVVDADGVISWSYLSPMAINPGVNGVLDALEALKNKNA
ncbi:MULTISPECIES: redoxin domain-containing protein [Gordonia]|uniref:Putative peroxiredoxin n=1 Tax=Gordonia sputi NBRC 100414 TaxID=1089453 RepID=H5TUQ0_9ACTN|nr:MULTISPECIES: redoxin domain-containing protein [Gordonia]MCM3895932.1 redoxin domain-containing protein [Gordonia sputi]NKY95594.1 redoxin domain-containing protein [Gordonia sputi]OBA41623.1 thioredoxin peroxidase [Gordonia sp. 852002-51296_SCH5728562-b]OBA67022.1 thioredoxin peroxidase [Gordonia sp. 852002-10350_SCH5691597]GAB37208.1 putative peroxiredoxin [Gordonia sputi NBRC 100414]